MDRCTNQMKRQKKLFTLRLLVFLFWKVTIFFHYTWVAPLMVVVIAILCWREIGIYILPGIFLFLLLGPFQVYVGRFFAKMR